MLEIKKFLPLRYGEPLLRIFVKVLAFLRRTFLAGDEIIDMVQMASAFLPARAAFIYSAAAPSHFHRQHAQLLPVGSAAAVIIEQVVGEQVAYAVI